MSVRTLFATPLYDAPLGDDTLVAALADACRVLAEEDRAGRRWSAEHGYRGYTSYSSLDDLPQRDPDIAALVPLLDRHVARFATACGYALKRRLKLDSIWVNVLKPGGHHSGHIHPGTVVSGTLYLEVPLGSGAIQFEDPRLPQMMAAPLRDEQFVRVEPEAGQLLLWESWLRHEVLASRAKTARISISFNYRR